MSWFSRLFGRRDAPREARPPLASRPRHDTQVSAPIAPPSRSGFAVLDVETTGLSPRDDRVVSIALVLVDPWGRVEHEWSSLVNPEGPVGATHIHGITDADVAGAPTFEHLVPEVFSLVGGRAIVAHNATFDLGFLRNEIDRAGWGWPADTPFLCTLKESFHFQPQLDRRRLADCCWDAGVDLVDAHSALGDARATAQLFSMFVRSAPEVPVRRGYDTLLARAAATVWPIVRSGPRTPAAERPVERKELSERARRNIAAARVPRPRLLDSFTLSDALDDGASPATLIYLELLAEALEDGELSEHERTALQDLADQYGLAPADVASAHLGLVRALAREAVEDGRVTAAERSELRATASLLDVDEREVSDLLAGQDDARVSELSANLPPLPTGWALGEPLRIGQRVAFTGCEAVGRDDLERRTADAGLRPTNNVSRRTAVLVSDGTVDGTKARAARQLGVRIVTPFDYATLLRHRQPPTPDASQQLTPRPQPQPSIAAVTVAVVAATALTQVTSAGSNDGRRAAPAEVRTWALANGYAVGSRGRLPAEVWAAHAAAHPIDSATH